MFLFYIIEFVVQTAIGRLPDWLILVKAKIELGRLQTKTISNGADATNYSYNIQGHITEINGTNFSENLYYNTNTANLPNFTSCFNGNIAGMKWSVPNEQLGYQRAYSFAYDDLNRLTNSVYSGNNSNQIVSGTLNKYNEKLDYQDDKTGKLKGLIRYENGSLVENLNLVYQGNQIQKVDNSLSHFVAYGSELFRDYDNHIVIPREYAYDTNGNMLYDANNGVSDIEYNVLNLPDKVHFTAGHKNKYTYDAGGQKLRVVNYSSNQILDIPMGTITPLSSNPSDYTILTTDYVGNMIYENGALKEILLPEGYYQNGTFYYYLKDHLGDNRVTINSSGAVVEKSHYYPSGTRFFTESTNNDLKPLPYRYNGKEMEAMNGLNQMDYGARRRLSWGPVWTGVDPMAEKYYSISPYAYCAGNPVRFIDVKGKYIDIYYSDKNNKQQVYRFTGKGGNTKIPDNIFVKNFIKAYNYDIKNGDNKKNGGGQNLYNAARSSDIGIKVVQTNGTSSNRDYNFGDQNVNVVEWNTNKGLKTTEGYRMSPATILEHEIAHAFREQSDLKKSDLQQFNLDTNKGSDKQYDTKEERRVETGTEAKTANANGEFPDGYMRKNHLGTGFTTTSPTSNTEQENE